MRKILLTPLATKFLLKNYFSPFERAFRKKLPEIRSIFEENEKSDSALNDIKIQFLKFV